MFKRQIRYDGQKRVSIGRPVAGRTTDNSQSRKFYHDTNYSLEDSNREYNCDNPGSPSGIIKIEHSPNNVNLGSTVPAIQMNEDSLTERERGSMEQLVSIS